MSFSLWARHPCSALHLLWTQKAVTSLRPPQTAARGSLHLPVPTPRWKGREGNIPTNGEHTSRGRAQGRTTTCYALIFLKRYHLFLGHLWSLPGQILVITRHSKHACLTIHIRPSVKEIRPVMSKSRLNKRKWGQSLFCCGPSTFRLMQSTHTLSLGGKERAADKNLWLESFLWAVHKAHRSHNAKDTL